MMTRFLLTALCVLLTAAPASAECAWLLWASGFTPTSGEKVWDLLSAYSQTSGGESECTRAAEGFTKRAQLDERSKRFMRTYICIPDTIDPRGPKGKQ